VDTRAWQCRDRRPAGATRSTAHKAGIWLKARLSSAWRWAVLARSRNATTLVRGRRLMVLAPHPDDETLGCGGLIAGSRAVGAPVTLVVATDGRHSSRSTVLTPDQVAAVRRAELSRAGAILGVPEGQLIQLGCEDGTLAERLPELAIRIAALLQTHRPEILLVPCAQDQHTDHQALHTAAVRAVVSNGVSCVVLAYPVWTWIHAPWFGDAPAHHRASLVAWSLRQLTTTRWWRVPCGDQLSTKGAAIAAYPSQVTNLTGESTWSYLPRAYLSLFLGSVELFLPVRTLPAAGPRRQ
jgi:LmbE family N-acetylglucosaminyl deacetylase